MKNKKASSEIMNSWYVWIAALAVLFIILGFLYQGLAPTINKFIFGLPSQEPEHVVIDMTATTHKTGDTCSIKVGEIGDNPNSNEAADVRALLIMRDGVLQIAKDMDFIDKKGERAIEWDTKSNDIFNGISGRWVIGEFITSSYGANPQLRIIPNYYFSNNLLKIVSFEELLKLDGAELNGLVLCKYPSSPKNEFTNLMGYIDGDGKIFMIDKNEYVNTGFVLKDTNILRLKKDSTDVYEVYGNFKNGVITIFSRYTLDTPANTNYVTYSQLVNQRIVKTISYENKNYRGYDFTKKLIFNNLK